MKIKYLLCLLILIPAPRVEAQQECNSNRTQTTPSNDFVDHGDGTVTHKSTGLMWKKCSEGLTGMNCDGGAIKTFTWKYALELADGQIFAGYHDWHIPNIKELASIVELACYFPAINLDVFPNVNLNIYPNDPGPTFWSNSPAAYGEAWMVDFRGGVESSPVEGDGLRVRLVRDAN